MLTIYSSFRSCRFPRFAEIQRWAASSWIRINPRPEVIIFGNDEGSEELCKEFDFIHIPEVNKTVYGTPILKDIVLQVDDLAKNDDLALVSGDIILFDDVIQTLKRVKEQMSQYCIVAQRKDNWLKELDFSQPNWQEVAKKDLSPTMRSSGDFFMYPKGFWQINVEQFPPIITGRGNADSYLFWEAGERGKLIEATQVLTLVHPHHEHPHVPEGNPEYEENIKTVNGRRGTLDSANWIMNSDYTLTHKTAPLNL